ncbi:MAG: hypothetical protein WCZ66_09210 [Sphingomonadaceae bacterium]
MARIGSMVVNLALEDAAFINGLKRASAQSDDFSKKIGQLSKSMQAWGKNLSLYVSGPVAAMGTGMAAAVQNIARTSEEIRKAAQLSNVGREQFQRLAYAAKSVGFESDKLSDIFKDVNDKVGDFMQTGGGPMADFFENIAPKVGVTAQQFRNLSGPQALQLYYNSLEKANVSQADMTFYMEALANDATALVPLLKNGGAAFREMGRHAAIITDSDEKRLREYTESVRRMQESMKGVAIAIARSGILDMLADLARRAGEFINRLSKLNPETVKWGIAIAGVAAAAGPLVLALGTALPILMKLGPIGLGVGVGLAAAAAGGFDFAKALRKIAGEASAADRALERARRNDKSYLWGAVRVRGKPIPEDPRLQHFDELSKGFGRYNGQAFISNMADEMAVATTPDFSDFGDRLAAAMAKAGKTGGEKAAAAAEAAFEEMERRRIQALRDTLEFQERMRMALGDGDMLRLGVLDTTGLAEHARKAGEQFREIADGPYKRMADFGQQISDNLAQAIINGRGVGSALIASFEAAAAKWAMSNFAKALFGDGTAAGGGGLFGSIAGIFGGARANGGPVSANKAYLVGERGPELIVPRSAGQVIANDNLGGRTVVQNFNINAQGAVLAESLMAETYAIYSPAYLGSVQQGIASILADFPPAARLALHPKPTQLSGDDSPVRLVASR